MNRIEKLKSVGVKVIAALGALSAFLISGFIAIIIPATSTAFYKSQYAKNDTLEYVRRQSVYLEGDAQFYVANMTEEQLLELMHRTMRYCLYLEDDLNPTIDGKYLKIFRNEEGETLTDGCLEIDHMADVKGVFGGGLILVGTSAVVLIVGIALSIIFCEEFRKYCKKTPYITIIAALCVLATIGVVAAVNFDYAFTLFHKIFFDGSQWQFSSGVMIAMIGDIFTGIVPVIIGIWVGLIAVVVVGTHLYSKFVINRRK